MNHVQHHDICTIRIENMSHATSGIILLLNMWHSPDAAFHILAMLTKLHPLSAKPTCQPQDEPCNPTDSFWWYPLST